MKQQKLFKDSPSAFGGSLLKNSHAKRARPFSSKVAMHLVLKANRHCLRHYDQRVEKLIEKQAYKHFVKLHLQQVMSNHIHLAIQAKTKAHYKAFVRSIAGLIPRLLKLKQIWQSLPFTCLVEWGHRYRRLKSYFRINFYQSQGYTKQQARFMVELEKGYYELEAG